MRKILVLSTIITMFSACGNQQKVSDNHPAESTDSTASSSSKKPAPVALIAVAETEAVRAVEGEDAADDPAFWYNQQNPANSLIIGSNKREGIEVYNLGGRRIAHYPTGRVNNVDVAQQVQLGKNGQMIDIVAGSNRSYNRIDIWQIDSSGEQFRLISDTHMRSQLKEVYGFCLYRAKAQEVYAFVNGKSGKVEQYMLHSTENSVGFELVSTFAADKQTEGIVVDTIAKKLYLGVEEQGILQFDMEGSQVTNSRRLAMSGEENPDLEYDIEGLTVHYAQNGERYLLASSQGNNRYAVFHITETPRYINYFTIADGPKVDGAAETDGIDVCSKAITPQYPEGIFIVQDGFNTGPSGDALPQNFKMLSIAEVMKAVL